MTCAAPSAPGADPAAPAEADTPGADTAGADTAGADAFAADAAREAAERALRDGDPDRARAALDAALAAAPEDTALLTLAVAAARAAGDLAAAAQASGRLAALQPFNLPVAWLDAILNGRAPDTPLPMGLELPPPFAIVDGALPRSWRDRIWHEAFAAPDRFAPAAVIDEDGQYADPDSRSARLIAEAGGAAREVGAEVAARLPDLLPRLAVPAFEPGRIEVQVTLHGDGDFFRVHQDRPLDPDPSIAGRRVSFVYYLSRVPRPYRGGTLRLYDTSAAAATWRPDRWTAVVPEDNRLIVFPVQAFHEVTAVRVPTADPRDGRLTVNGWIHAAE